MPCTLRIYSGDSELIEFLLQHCRKFHISLHGFQRRKRAAKICGLFPGHLIPGQSFVVVAVVSGPHPTVLRAYPWWDSGESNWGAGDWTWVACMQGRRLTRPRKHFYGSILSWAMWKSYVNSLMNYRLEYSGAASCSRNRALPLSHSSAFLAPPSLALSVPVLRTILWTSKSWSTA